MCLWIAHLQHLNAGTLQRLQREKKRVVQFLHLPLLPRASMNSIITHVNNKSPVFVTCVDAERMSRITSICVA